jgi:hypothetical protein
MTGPAIAGAGMSSARNVGSPDQTSTGGGRPGHQFDAAKAGKSMQSPGVKHNEHQGENTIFQHRRFHFGRSDRILIAGSNGRLTVRENAFLESWTDDAEARSLRAERSNPEIVTVAGLRDDLRIRRCERRY